MSLWGSVDNDASEPKNLATGEFQGTAGKAIYGVDDTEQGVAMLHQVMLVSMLLHTLVGLQLIHIQICTEKQELKLKLL